MNIFENLKKKKILVLLGAGAAAILLLIILLAGGSKTPSGPPRNKSEKVRIDLLGKGDLEKESWRATSEKEIENLKKTQQEMDEKLRLLNEQLRAKQEAKQEISKPSPATAGIGSLPLQIPDLTRFPPDPTPTGGPAAPAKPAGPSQAPQTQQQGVFSFGPDIKAVSTTQAAIKPKPVKQADVRSEIPSASFIKGVLLSGLDAPTGINSSKEPHPVLIQLTDLAVLPNQFRFDVKECGMIGEGYGELASERAYIRVINLSCVKNNGKIFDLPISGFIAGEDGKNGMRGRVVSKEGQLIAKALVAGFAEGLAKVFTLSASTVSVSPLGATQTFEPDRALEAGALSGMATAAKSVSQYYLRMAERMFPVIEIDAGRKVDVVLLKKVTFETAQEE